MPDRASLVSNLRQFCLGSPKKTAILKAVRKRKSYKEVARKVNASENYCSTVLNGLRANELVEGKRGFYQQTRLMRTINIDSELKKKKPEKKSSRPTGEPASEKRVSKEIFSLEKALDQLDIDPVIERDCFPLRKPYRTRVGEAYLTLENFIKQELQLPDSLVGIDVVSEAAKKGLFNRSVNSERDGLNHIFRGAVLWLRNPAHHRKGDMPKEDALKMILFADYLMKLVGKQKELNNL
jgi:hypothetical protein